MSRRPRGHIKVTSLSELAAASAARRQKQSHTGQRLTPEPRTDLPLPRPQTSPRGTVSPTRSGLKELTLITPARKNGRQDAPSQKVPSSVPTRGRPVSKSGAKTPDRRKRKKKRKPALQLPPEALRMIEASEEIASQATPVKVPAPVGSRPHSHKDTASQRIPKSAPSYQGSTSPKRGSRRDVREKADRTPTPPPSSDTAAESGNASWLLGRLSPTSKLLVNSIARATEAELEDVVMSELHSLRIGLSATDPNYLSVRSRIGEADASLSDRFRALLTAHSALVERVEHIDQAVGQYLDNLTSEELMSIRDAVQDQSTKIVYHPDLVLKLADSDERESVDRLTERVSFLESENERLFQSLAEEKTTTEEAIRAHETAQTRLQQATAALDTAVAQKELVERELESSMSEQQRLDREVATVNARLRFTNRELEAARDRVYKLERTVGQLRDELSAAGSLATPELQFVTRILSEEIPITPRRGETTDHSFSSDEIGSEDAIASLQKTVSDKDKQIAELRARLQDIEGKLLSQATVDETDTESEFDLDSELGSSESDAVTASPDRIAALERQMHEIQSQLLAVGAQDRVAKLEFELERFKRKNRRLKQKLIQHSPSLQRKLKAKQERIPPPVEPL